MIDAEHSHLGRDELPAPTGDAGMRSEVDDGGGPAAESVCAVGAADSAEFAAVLGDPPEIAGELFGPALAVAVQFAELLASVGVERGLIGPREVSILWERHLVNCALLADLLPVGARVVDVGSGGGLPGIVLAIRRPDLSVDLVEPMLRRTVFLEQAVDLLGLAGRVRVVRGRAEEKQVRVAVGTADWVTARAVAPLDRLVRWCLPLLSDDGTLLALKGRRAAEEVDSVRSRVGALGAVVRSVDELGSEDDATWVVRVQRAPRRKRGAHTLRTARRSQ